MKVAGVEVPPSLAAELALRLHAAGELGLARQVGSAVDHNLDEVDLNRRDCEDILRVLDDTAAGQDELHQALLRWAGYASRSVSA